MERLLPVTDLHGRDLVLSCGAALHHLRVALAASGIGTSVHRTPRPAEAKLLATINLSALPAAEDDLRAGAAVIRRRTDRRRFGDWPVPDAFLDELRTVAEREGAALRVVDATAGGRALVLAAMCEAERIRHVMTRYTTETAVWTARLTGDDGVPRANLLADPAGTGDGFARGFPAGRSSRSPAPTARCCSCWARRPTTCSRSCARARR